MTNRTDTEQSVYDHILETIEDIEMELDALVPGGTPDELSQIKTLEGELKFYRQARDRS
jgi:hypothetical protein